MLKSMNEVAANQHGRKVLLYLLHPRDTHHFHPDIIRILQEGDMNPNRYSLLILIVHIILLHNTSEHKNRFSLNSNCSYYFATQYIRTQKQVFT